MPSLDVPREARQCFEHHLGASYFTGARFGITRLIQVIAVVSLGASALDLAYITAANGCGLMVSLVLGKVMKSQRKLPYLVIPAVLSNAVLLCVALVSSLPLFVVLVSVHGFLDTCTLPAMGSIQRNTYPVRLRGGMVGYIRSRFMLCGLISGLLMAEILEMQLLSYRILLPLAGVLGFVACFHFMCMNPREQIEQLAAKKVGSSLLDPLRNRDFMSFTIILTVFECAHVMIQPLIPGILIGLGVDGRGMVWFFAIIPAVCGVFAFPFWGRVIDRIGVVHVRALGSVAYAIEALLLVGAIPIASMCALQPYTVVMCAACIRGVSLAAILLSWSLGPLHFSDRENCSHYIGVHNFGTGIRLLCAPLLGVWLLHFFSSQNVLMLSGTVMLMSSGMFFLLAVQLTQQTLWSRT